MRTGRRRTAPLWATLLVSTWSGTHQEPHHHNWHNDTIRMKPLSDKIFASCSVDSDIMVSTCWIKIMIFKKTLNDADDEDCVVLEVIVLVTMKMILLAQIIRFRTYQEEPWC